ncbi:N-acetyltransferase [Vibrio anguillarum]|jgi:RimJ/RimL family protein N-acetyltransferase|uniref:N-acetyltransferase n=3 Tax=Vibrio TaxID=662 RepID=A0ABD4R064_VIBAN|nr:MULTISPECIES: GNAT family protein [Vibrio]ASG01566.1 GNAT family N-acetyltransferase [Vibrio anguillarum]ASG01674.1 GNAT family N-acetyltransferase [Vibrio anguillarum]ASG05416.1 GNAT family N-acetyltransferase [Vibrio anguillarum]MBF4246418.1 N-acetyltransferase [Vibrio anguillarum]MBF4374929.1 N-acetyltransferase [Vibrio anguillarum]
MQLELDDYYLRSLEVEDTEAFYKWSRDREITLYSLSSYAYPQSKSDIGKWLLSINSNAKTVSFGICSKENDKLIGYAGISGISTLNRSGEYFILIGEKSYWGKGVGTSVTKIVTNYAIRTLGLHRVQLTASTLNLGAIKAYENAGYKHEGVMRQSGFRNGEFVDKVLMSVLSTEWAGI